nr:glyoxalase superfamily protein [Amylibacter sp.]
MTSHRPTLFQAKEQAKRLRAKRAAEGVQIGHAKALEVVAQEYGFRDWNTFHAAIANRPPEGWSLGGRVQGRYLSQPFQATIIALKMLRPGWYQLTLDLDEAVDVVTFDSFSNFRKRVHGVVGPAGTTQEKTSDGTPHLSIDL